MRMTTSLQGDRPVPVASLYKPARIGPPARSLTIACAICWSIALGATAEVRTDGSLGAKQTFSGNVTIGASLGKAEGR